MSVQPSSPLPADAEAPSLVHAVAPGPELLERPPGPCGCSPSPPGCISLRDGHLVRLIQETINHADHRITGEPLHR